MLTFHQGPGWEAKALQDTVRASRSLCSPFINHCTLSSMLSVLRARLSWHPLSAALFLQGPASAQLRGPRGPLSLAAALQLLRNPAGKSRVLAVRSAVLPPLPAFPNRTYLRRPKCRRAAMPPPVWAGHRRSRRSTRAMRRWPAYRQTRRARSSGCSAPPCRNRFRSSGSPTPWKMLAEARLRPRLAVTARPERSLATEAGVPIVSATAGIRVRVPGSAPAAQPRCPGIRRGCPAGKGERLRKDALRP